MIDFAGKKLLGDEFGKIEDEYRKTLDEIRKQFPQDDADILLFQLRAQARINARETRDARIKELLDSQADGGS